MNYTRNNYEEHALDYLEGKMTEEQSNRFKHFLLSNPDIYNEVAELKLVYLTPDLSVQFPDKQRLHQTRSNRSPFRMWYAIAAALIILISFVFLLSQPQSTQSTELVEGSSMEEVDPRIEGLLENSPTLLESDLAEVDLGTEQRADDVVKAIKSEPKGEEIINQGSADRSFAKIDPLIETISEVEAVHQDAERQIDFAKIEVTNEKIETDPSLDRNSFPVIDQLPMTDLTESVLDYELKRDETLVAISEAEVESDRSTMGKLLASINLIPSGLRDLDKDEIREKVMPEFIASRD